MNRFVAVAGLLLCGSLSQRPLQAQTSAPVLRPADQLAWRTVAPGFAMATADGDPEAAGQPYTLMIRLDDGAWIAPHRHNSAKRVLVLQGALLVGHGPRVQPAEVTELPAGGFLLVPPGHVHYEGARGATLIAIYGIGPLRTTFVPAGS